MNSKIERAEKLLFAAVIANNNKAATRVAAELMQEWSLEIGRVLQPINFVRLPYIVAVCEQYAQALRDMAPAGVSAVIDELKSIPASIILFPAEGDHGE